MIKRLVLRGVFAAVAREVDRLAEDFVPAVGFVDL